MELYFGQPNSHNPQYGNTVNMEFSNSGSSDFDFSGGSPTSFTAATCTSFSAAGTMEAMREAIFRAAAMQPVEVDIESLRAPPGRKNVRISKDPQSVAARLRRERISHRIRVLQRMVPGGTKMDTASMLDEAAHYLRFLKKQVELLEQGSAQDYRPVMGDAFFPGGGGGGYN